MTNHGGFIVEETKYAPLQFRDNRRLTRKERRIAKNTGHCSIGIGEDCSEFARGIRNDRFLMVTGPQVHCPRQPPSQRRLTKPEAYSAVAFIRCEPRDIRPEIHMLASGNTNGLRRVFAYCRNYLRIACERLRIKSCDAIQKQVAKDALIKLFRPSKAKTQEECAKKLRMRKAEYGEIFAIAHGMLMRRLDEAVARRRLARTGTGFCPKGVSLNYGLDRIAAMASQTPAHTQAIPFAPITAAVKPQPSQLAY
jgi:hypothetical protein